MLPLKVITEATWIKKYLKENYGLSAEVVKNGIRKDIYTDPGEAYSNRKEGKLRVLIEGPLGVFFKNVEKAIQVCRESQADEIWLLTPTKVSKYPGVDRVFSQVPIFETPKIYRSCDVLVKLSYVEGMFGPPLEMFHCGGTAIIYNVSGHEEYIRHDENALVVPKNNEEQVISYINELKNNPKLIDKLKRGALQTAKDWPDWEIVSKDFEKVIKKFVTSKSEPQSLIEKKSKFFSEFYVIAGKNKPLPDSKIARIARELEKHPFLKKIFSIGFELLVIIYHLYKKLLVSLQLNF